MATLQLLQVTDALFVLVIALDRLLVLYPFDVPISSRLRRQACPQQQGDDFGGGWFKV
jgi:hypothetical protein